MFSLHYNKKAIIYKNNTLENFEDINLKDKERFQILKHTLIYNNDTLKKLFALYLIFITL